jgi:hypothetical protein
MNEAESKNKEEYMACEKVWKETLEHFGIYRPVLPFEKMKISRLIKQYDYVSVIYALTGARFEAKTENFNPANHVGLSRIEQAHIFEKFVNLAAQKKKKIDPVQATAVEVSTDDLVDRRADIAKLIGGCL